MRPTSVTSKKNGRRIKADVDLKVIVADQPGSYYSGAGMTGMGHGKEIPLMAYAEVRCRLQVAGVWLFTYTGNQGLKCQIGKAKSNPLDYSLDMKPPFHNQDLKIKPVGKSWQNAELWIPPSATRSKKKFEVSNRVWADVYAKAGVKFGGQGTAKVTYKAYVGDTEVQNCWIWTMSWTPGVPEKVRRAGSNLLLGDMSSTSR